MEGNNEIKLVFQKDPSGNVVEDRGAMGSKEGSSEGIPRAQAKILRQWKLKSTDFTAFSEHD